MALDPRMDRPSFERLIRSAQAGSRDDLGELLEQFRQYLRLVASSGVESGPMRGGSTSDLVQETFLKAQARLKGFTGRTEEEFKGWLRQILVNILTDWRRYNVAEKRDVRREVSLETLTDWDTGEIPSADATPSGRLIADERRRIVARALRRLPQDYARVIELRHRRSLPFPQVAKELGRSEGATRQLWMRAVERLSEEIADVSDKL